MTRSIQTTRRALIVGAAVAMATPVRAQTRAPLRIAYLKAPNDLTLAKAHGSLEKALAPLGVRVEWAGPFAAAAPAVEALAGGAVDLTAGSSTAFITARAADVALVLFGYQRISPSAEAILVAKASPIVSIRDLVGRSVAVNRGGTGEYILVRALTRAGVPLDQVKRVYLGPVDANAAFSSGAVDAWAIWDPFISMALAKGETRVLADGAQCGSENAVAFFVGQSYLAANRDVMQAVLAVLQQENAWARANRDEAGVIWAREMGLPATLGPRLGENNTPPLVAVGPEQAAQVERVADWFVENRIVPNRPEIGRFLVDLGKAS